MYDFLENINIYDLDWVDVQYINYINSFCIVYKIEMPLIFVLAASIEFMRERMECGSCIITQEYYEEFNNWLWNTRRDMKN